MAEPRRGWTDLQVDQRIGNLLRVGVLVSALVVLVGGALLVAQEWDSRPKKSIFVGEPAELRSFSGVVQDALAFDPKGIVQFGLLLLLLTPVARVAFSAFAFWLQRDWAYVAITLIVFVVLLFSLAGEKLYWSAASGR
jgi:uncharacterized membrane protein